MCSRWLIFSPNKVFQGIFINEECTVGSNVGSYSVFTSHPVEIEVPALQFEPLVYELFFFEIEVACA